MSEKTTVQQMDELTRRRYLAMEAVCTQAKTLLPILKDHNLKNVADELGARIFELDAIQQELEQVVLRDPFGAMRGLLDRMRKV